MNQPDLHESIYLTFFYDPIFPYFPLHLRNSVRKFRFRAYLAYQERGRGNRNRTKSLSEVPTYSRDARSLPYIFVCLSQGEVSILQRENLPYLSTSRIHDRASFYALRICTHRPNSSFFRILHRDDETWIFSHCRFCDNRIRFL